VKASLARQIQKNIGRPTTKSFIKIVNNNLLPKCPVTQQDIIAAEHIFGPDIGSLKGKTVHHHGDTVEPGLTAIPHSILSRYHDVTICADVMYVNKIPFFMSISQNIKFGTAEMLNNQQSQTLLKAIQQIHNL
jgi:hypothetical protein